MANEAIEKRENRSGTPERLEQGAWFTPLVDIIETNEAFVFQTDLPGVKAEDLDINFENGVLTIDGKVQSRQGAEHDYLWQEYGVGHFYRQFTIDAPVNVEAIKAELKNGELTLHVPKAETAKTRKIRIQTS